MITFKRFISWMFAFLLLVISSIVMASTPVSSYGWNSTATYKGGGWHPNVVFSGTFIPQRADSVSVTPALNYDIASNNQAQKAPLHYVHYAYKAWSVVNSAGNYGSDPGGGHGLLPSTISIQLTI